MTVDLPGVTHEPVFMSMLVSDVLTDSSAKPDTASSDAVLRLVASLPTTGGLLSPIGVDTDGVLIYGRDRLEAHRLLGWVTISARVYPAAGLDDQARQSLRWEENHIRSRPDLEVEGELLRQARPFLEEAATKARRRNGVNRANDMWGQDSYLKGAEIVGGNLPPAITPDDVDPIVIVGGNLPPAIISSLQGPGKARDKLRDLLSHSPKTIEKFNIIVALSEDDSLPVGTREAIMRERAAANTSDQVDGHLKRAVKLAATASTTVETAPAKSLQHKVVELVTLAEQGLRRLDFDTLVLQGTGDPMFIENMDGAYASAQRIVLFFESARARMTGTGE